LKKNRRWKFQRLFSTSFRYFYFGQGTADLVSAFPSG
jgi:hypothetical protein